MWLIWVFNFLFQESIQFLPWQNIAVKGSGSYLTTPWSLTMAQLTTSSSCLKYWLMVQNISQLWSAATKNKLKHKQQSLLWKAWALFLKMLTCLLFSGTPDSPFPHYALPRAHNRSEQLELDCARAMAFLQTSLFIDQIFPRILTIK